MSRSSPPARWLLAGAALLAAFSFLGVVMGETHVPVAVEPDAKPEGGLQLATFALG